MDGEAAEDRSGDKGYVVALMGALAGAVVTGLVGFTILTLVVNRYDWENASLDTIFDSIAWGIFLVLVFLPAVAFLVGGAGTYLSLRVTGHRAPLRTALYTMILSIPCAFVAATLIDGEVSLLLGLVAASLIARRLALGAG